MALAGLAMAAYHMLSTQVMLQAAKAHANTHLGFCLLVLYLGEFASEKGKFQKYGSLGLALLALMCTGYVQVLWPELENRAYFNTRLDLVIGVILIFLVLEAARRDFGLILPALALFVVIYPFFGKLFPEPFRCQALDLDQTIANLSIGVDNGIYGIVLPTSANYIFPFVIFGGVLQAIAPTEIFFTYLKCAVLAGFVFALPVIFWQIWRFVAPGLYPAEKHAIVPFVVVSTLLFSAGAVFGYTMVFPLMFNFFTQFDSDFVRSAWTMREVFALTTRLFLAFGVAFELPVLVFFLAIAGIVDAPTLLRGTPYAVLAVFVTAAILTPPDWVSQVFLAVPMVGLYLLGVGVAWLFDRSRREPKGESTPVAR